MQDEALTRLFAVGAVLGPAMREGLDEWGLTPARAELIWRLHHLGPMNQRQLSEILECTPRNVTGLVDGLEDVGLVERQAHPSDRRATLVTLTKDGQELARTWIRQSRELARRLFEDVAVDDIGHLVSTLDVVLDRLGATVNERSAS